jgi:hypothetical protein
MLWGGAARRHNGKNSERTTIELRGGLKIGPLIFLFIAALLSV